MHSSDKQQNSKLKIAELTSGIGALVLGIGIGCPVVFLFYSANIPISAMATIARFSNIVMFDKGKLKPAPRQAH